ncbi:MAG: pilin [Candidatus Peregrinibacteria bacterium]|nr:pilin [Candidatus Peregrinibacteria bacterium]
MKKIIKKILVLMFISIAISTAMPTTYAVTHAADQFKPSYIPRPSNLPGPESSENARTKLVDSILPRFAVGMIGMTGGFALLMIVIGGVRYLTAYGNEEAAGKGKNQIMYGVIGMIVALLAYTIVTAITNLNIENQTLAPTTQTPTTPAANP